MDMGDVGYGYLQMCNHSNVSSMYIAPQVKSMPKNE